MLTQIFNLLKRKTVDPKVYAIGLYDIETDDQIVWVGYAFTLDDAYLKAKAFYVRGGYKPAQLMLSRYMSETFDNLLKEHMQAPEEVESDRTTVNSLMQVIIETKDFDLYTKHIDKFNTHEKAYILEKIHVSSK